MSVLKTNVSIDTAIKCARRELALRRNVYPRFIADAKRPDWTEEKAREELQAMEAVIVYLEFLRGAARSFNINVLHDEG